MTSQLGRQTGERGIASYVSQGWVQGIYYRLLFVNVIHGSRQVGRDLEFLQKRQCTLD